MTSHFHNGPAVHSLRETLRGLDIRVDDFGENMASVEIDGQPVGPVMTLDGAQAVVAWLVLIATRANTYPAP